MKILFNLLLAVITISVLVFGQLHWQEKISNASSLKDNSGPVQVDAQLAESQGLETEELLALVTNWPEQAKQSFQEALAEDREFTILIVGSDSLGTGPTSWPEVVKAELASRFGEHLSVEIMKYEDTSASFVLGDKQTDWNTADLILWEPFTLNDNGNVEIADSLENITLVMDAVLEANPKATFMLQPPNPIYQAKFYPLQVAALQTFAQEQAIPYLDHWSAWPDPATDAILPYLDEEGSYPSAEGMKVWADYVLSVLIAG